MRMISMSLCFAVAAALAVPASAEENTLSEAEKKAGWTLLFDGETKEGWRNYKKDSISDGWVVKDGALVRAEQGAGDIITEGEYGNFELSLEYKISPEGNSGIMFLVTEEADRPWQTGPEIQVQDNEDGHDPQKAGWLYQLYKPRTNPETGEPLDATRPVGEWNHIQLRVTESGCEINVNGIRYSQFKIGSDDWNRRVAQSKFSKFEGFGKADKGHICLQDHGDEVAYRNIMVRELEPDGTAPEPIDGTLALKPVLAYPDLEWADWEPLDDRGRPEAFRSIVLTHAGDDSGRVFVAEQRGRIYVFENSRDVKESKVFIDLEDRVTYQDKQNEEGFLGLAFHPRYEDNGEFFVYYTTSKKPNTSVISRFRVDPADANRADPDSEEVIMEIEQPFWNHNGGTIEFGPDGYLYVGLGDGGSANDPYDNAQNLGTLLGSILRIDVDRKENGKNYAIPEDNPFTDSEDKRPEIYAYGLRNVWRLGFDRETGHLWAADVGQNLWEEINIVTNGGNYGWNRREGMHPFGREGADASDDLIDPIWEYDHQVGKSITGGVVYRGKKLPELYGKYVYADYVSGKIWALKYDEENEEVVSNEAIPSPKMPIVSFGEDAEGEIYFLMVTPNGKSVYTFEKE
ncbi:Quinoprotein glucose dehydrogenase B precursor [Maioricimonas rarisocia]|uniref:Quinoprotein glucose dehydrogenase B n=1 Tax=Maioricimonas rarisocia TaxID=2528026 RepID=A0A517Z7H3_9PLAN|nr:PQQ-dependent sugar dehydrogenase [Maioricimonas rarisocia]QDU38410.1 Quinoprotein glucose dehydrogenase B precursor [Maioricimonas rarisocia]